MFINLQPHVLQQQSQQRPSLHQTLPLYMFSSSSLIMHPNSKSTQDQSDISRIQPPQPTSKRYQGSVRAHFEVPHHPSVINLSHASLFLCFLSPSTPPPIDSLCLHTPTLPNERFNGSNLFLLEVSLMVILFQLGGSLILCHVLQC